MSSAVHSLADLQPRAFHPALTSPPAAPRATPRSSGVIRRRLDKENGRALEQIGHAIEYLMDSRHLEDGQSAQHAMTEAIEILSKASRDVFACCPEIVPSERSRFLRWLERFSGSPGKPIA